MKVSNQTKASIRETAAIFKALSDENRLAIYLLLRDCCGSGCELAEAQTGSYVSEIAENFDLSLSTVSHHLKELRNAGLIVCEKQGQWVCCRPNFEIIEEVREFLRE